MLSEQLVEETCAGKPVMRQSSLLLSTTLPVMAVMVTVMEVMTDGWVEHRKAEVTLSR